MSGWLSSRRLSLLLGRESRPQHAVDDEQSKTSPSVPAAQTVLLLHGPKQEYAFTHDYPVPELLDDREVLIRSRAIGLNPIDWKAPDFNFGIPELPYIAGRELSGDIVLIANTKSEWKLNDRVIAISTDYRDLRKAAYQEYVVASDFNLVRLPQAISYEQGSALGVAFVAAALALGVSIGADFSSTLQGPDLFKIVRDLSPSSIPEDVRSETLDGIQDRDRPRPGDWLAIWGGSATSANLTIQLAKLIGLRVIVVVDKAKHGLRLSNHRVIRPDLLVDSHDPERAIQIIKASTNGQLRFGLDTRGRETASHLMRAIPSEPAFTQQDMDTYKQSSLPTGPQQSHLVGMTGLPKGAAPHGLQFHVVPIKLFHEVKEVGGALSAWLGRLLEKELIVPPEVIDVEHGLKNVNSGLNRMRKGEISGGKLIVRV